MTPLLTPRVVDEFVLRCVPNPLVGGPGDGGPRPYAGPCPRGTSVACEALGCDPNDALRRARASTRIPGDRETVRAPVPTVPPRGGGGERSRRSGSSSDSSMSIRCDWTTVFAAAQPDDLCGVTVELVAVVVMFREVARDDSLVAMLGS